MKKKQKFQSFPAILQVVTILTILITLVTLIFLITRNIFIPDRLADNLYILMGAMFFVCGYLYKWCAGLLSLLSKESFSTKEDVINKGFSESQIFPYQEYMDSILYTIPDIMYIFDKEGRFLDVFPPENELLIRPAKQLIGKTVHEVFRVEKADEILGIIRRILKKDDYEEFEYSIDIDHQKKWFSARAAKIELKEKSCVMWLDRNITERKKWEEALIDIAQGMSSEGGNDFFGLLVKNIASTLNVKYAFVTEIVSFGKKDVQTIAFWEKDHFGENFKYSVEGTPCENALSGKTDCYYPKDVQSRFPKDNNLKQLGAESFLGLPLHDSFGKVLGHLAIIDDHPIDKRVPHIPILQIFATRAGMELERKKDLEMIRYQQKRLDEAQHIAHIGSWEWDMDRDVISWSDEMYNIFGLVRNEFTPSLEEYLKYVHPDDQKRINEVFRDAQKKKKKSFKYSHNIIVRDELRTVDGTVKFDVDEQYGIRKMLGIVEDVTEKRMVEDRIERALVEKDILLKELNHRVKNNLQVISSIFDLEFDDTDNEVVREILLENQQRIKAIAFVHNMLYTNQDVSHIDFSEYINGITEELLRAFNIGQNKITIECDIENIKFDLTYAVPCGLVVNEVITNILKHAFPGDRKGKINIHFYCSDDDMYELEIKDNGVGLPEHLEYKELKSLGMKLIDALAFQLNGQVSFENYLGTIFKLKFKADQGKNNG